MYGTSIYSHTKLWRCLLIYTTHTQQNTQYDTCVQEKHSQMTNFLQNMKDPNSNQQQEMNAVLRGGRGQQKRLYSVDESIYGTEEGAKLQKDAHEKAEADQKKKNKRRRKKKNKGNDDNTGGTIDQGNDGDENTTVRVVQQSMAAVAVVGALAAGASFLLGGKRS